MNATVEMNEQEEEEFVTIPHASPRITTTSALASASKKPHSTVIAKPTFTKAAKSNGPRMQQQQHHTGSIIQQVRDTKQEKLAAIIEHSHKLLQDELMGLRPNNGKQQRARSSSFVEPSDEDDEGADEIENFEDDPTNEEEDNDNDDEESMTHSPRITANSNNNSKYVHRGNAPVMIQTTSPPHQQQAKLGTFNTPPTLPIQLHTPKVTLQSKEDAYFAQRAKTMTLQDVMKQAEMTQAEILKLSPRPPPATTTNVQQPKQQPLQQQQQPSALTSLLKQLNASAMHVEQEEPEDAPIQHPIQRAMDAKQFDELVRAIKETFAHDQHQQHSHQQHQATEQQHVNSTVKQQIHKLFASPSQTNMATMHHTPPQQQRKKYKPAPDVSPIPYSDVRHLHKTSNKYNHSTVDWYLNLCGGKYQRDISPSKTRIRWVGMTKSRHQRHPDEDPE